MGTFHFPAADEIPENVRVDVSRWERQYLVGGEIRRCSQGKDAISPICLRADDGTLQQVRLGQVARLSAEEALEALGAARKAWDNGRGTWPTMRVGDRIRCVEKFVELMPRSREEVVRLLMWEIGKARKEAENEFDRTVKYIHDTIEAVKELDRLSGRFVMEQGFIGQTRRSPLGVVLCMGPFNYPLNETYTTLFPALIMGNTVVSKLPRHGGFSHMPLLEAMQESFPPGVLNVIHGDGATIAGTIMASGEVDVLAFIGSSDAANKLKKLHPRPNRLRCILGLEAKNPAVVLPDADLDVAVREGVSGALSFNGQRCTGLKLFLVHKSIAEEFVQKLGAAVDGMKSGMPWDPGVQLTPLPEAGKSGQLAGLVMDALGKGARIVNAGGTVTGTFIRPPVVYPVRPDMELYHVEQFGPVVPVATYESETEIDAFMRESPYGQQISIFGRDPKRVAFLLDALANQVCRVNLNTQCRRGPDSFPFTGRKDSAEGTLSVTDALRCFSIRNVVSIASTDSDKDLISEIVTRRMSSFLTTDFIF